MANRLEFASTSTSTGSWNPDASNAHPTSYHGSPYPEYRQPTTYTHGTWWYLPAYATQLVGPYAETTQQVHPAQVVSSKREDPISLWTKQVSSAASEPESYSSTTSSLLAAHFPKRYFILKSLTQQDLDRSVETGLWTTQQHNEGILDRAFRTSKEVYLVFSVNKSGEFYGYAKMASAIFPPSSALPSTVPPPDELKLSHSPDRLPPRVPEVIASGEAPTLQADFPISLPTPPEDGPPKPFHVSWISTDRLPFHLTKDLRNPWNMGREVKISRDGIELEPGVGESLIGRWLQVGGAEKRKGKGKEKSQRKGR